MTRLNKMTREAIIDNAVKKSNHAECIAKITVDWADWAERVRIASLPKNMTERADRVYIEVKSMLKDIPEEYLSVDRTRRAYMYVNVAGQRIHAYFSGNANAEKHIYRFAPSHPNITAGDPLVDQFFALEKRVKKAANYKKSLRINVSAMVYSVTTIEKLLKVWPEVAELLPKETAPTVQLPSIQLADLNAMIGLPSEV